MVKPQAWTFSAAPIMDNKDHALFQDSSSLECEGPLMPSGQDKTGSSGHSSQTEVSPHSVSVEFRACVQTFLLPFFVGIVCFCFVSFFFSFLSFFVSFGFFFHRFNGSILCILVSSWRHNLSGLKGDQLT